MAWTTPATWSAGEVTAAEFNTQIRDNFKAIGDAWASYTPTLAQGASTNIAKTVNYAKYLTIGKLGILQIRVAATASGTAGSPITLTTPWTMASSNLTIGSGYFYDSSTSTVYNGVARQTSSTTVDVAPDGASTGGGAGLFPNVAIASGDLFTVSIICELA